MKKITIVVPCYNEQEVLPALHERLQQVIDSLAESYRFEVLLVNDGSKDQTLSVIKKIAQTDRRVSYLDLSRNFGKELAMIAGLDHADGDAVILMDADLQHPPEMIPVMLEYWQAGYDDVYTKRRNRMNEGFFKRHITEAFYDFLKKVSKVDVPKNVGDFRLLDKRCVAALQLLRESQRYTKGLFNWIGYRKKEILFDCQPRAAGETKWNSVALINLAVEGITSFTTFPLKIATIFGFLISFISLFYMGFVIINTLLFGEAVQGYPTLLSTILFLGGIQLIFLGVIGEYVGRIFNEGKNRPLYLVNEYNDQKVMYRGICDRPQEEILQQEEERHDEKTDCKCR